MNKLNFLKPDKENLTMYLYSGVFLFLIAVLDVFVGAFFEINITSFLPSYILSRRFEVFPPSGERKSMP